MGRQPVLEPRTVFRNAMADAGIPAAGVLRRIDAEICHLVADVHATPAIPAAQIVAPVFITGLPRSGTTYLHRLLDGMFGLTAPRAWEMMHPSPPIAGRSDPHRIGKCAEVLAAMPPALLEMHPTSATAAEECGMMTLLSYDCASLVTAFAAPDYARWFYQSSRDRAYGIHRRVLQHLQFGRPATRWVLKSPEHLFDLDALFRVYPDATVIRINRDVADVLPSFVRLFAELRATNGCAFDAVEAHEFCRVMLDKSAGDRRVRHVAFSDLIADPAAVTSLIGTII